MTTQTNTQHIGFQEVRVAAAGRWEGIHRALGIQLASTSHLKHTPCPGCGGKDRFRIDSTYQQTGRWICGGGGDLQSGDGFSLLGHVLGLTPLEQLKAVADCLGLSSMDNSEREKIRAIAEKQSAQMALDAARKHEQSRRDSNLLTALENMIDAIRYRQSLQRQAHDITSLHRVTTSPLQDEIDAAHYLNMAILDSYACNDQAAQTANQKNPTVSGTHPNHSHNRHIYRQAQQAAKAQAALAKIKGASV